MVNNKNIIFSSGLFGEYSPYYAIFNGKAKIFDLIIDQFLYKLPWDKTKKSFSGIKETNNLLVQKQHNKWLDFLEFYKEVRFKLLKGHLAQNNILNYSTF